MRCTIKLILALIVFAPILVQAGLSTKGYVKITENRTRATMRATMNVRHNADAPGSPYVQVYGSPGGSITISGRDDKLSFACNVLTSSPNYEEAVSLKNNFKNGSDLYVVRRTNSTNCESFTLTNRSYYMD